MRSASMILATIAFLGLHGSAVAQSAQRWSAQGSILMVSPSGDAYEGLGSGVGFELQARYTPSAFSLGAGYQRSSHDLDFDDGTSESVALSGPFIEPRYVIDVGSMSYAPYVAGRLAFLTQSLEISGISASASGTQVNFGGGVLVRLSPRVNLDLGATYGVINFDDVVVESGGQSYTFDGTSGSGQNLVLRAGVTVGIR